MLRIILKWTSQVVTWRNVVSSKVVWSLSLDVCWWYLIARSDRYCMREQLKTKCRQTDRLHVIEQIVLRSDGQGTPGLCSLSCAQKPATGPVLSQTNPILTVHHSFHTIGFNTIVPSTPRSSELSFESLNNQNRKRLFGW
jgi:hypothetical protein